MRQPPEPPPELPRSEPEIIPPGADFPPGRRFDGAMFHGGPVIRVTRLGPFGIALAALGAAALTVLGLALLLGAALIGAAAAGAIVVTAALARWLRGPPRR